MATLSLYLLIISLCLSSSLQTTVTVENPSSSRNPTKQIFNMVRANVHCCAPLDLEFRGQRGWFRAEHVTYSGLNRNPSYVYGFPLVRQQSSCRGPTVMAAIAHSGQWSSPMYPGRHSLGGTMWKSRLPGELSAEPTMDMMYPEFIVHENVHYELIRTLRETRVYEDLYGSIIVGRVSFPGRSSFHDQGKPTADSEISRDNNDQQQLRLHIRCRRGANLHQ